MNGKKKIYLESGGKDLGCFHFVFTFMIESKMNFCGFTADKILALVVEPGAFHDNDSTD